MTFLKNTWYVAANTFELEEGMVSRKICNEQILMFRTSSGSIAALHDLCPHRFVPLSMGRRIGDTVQCAYHGLRFDGSGACIEAPHDDEAQRERACVKSYNAIERHALVWLWMGEPSLADPNLIPDFGFIADTAKFGVAQGYTYIRGNYQMIADNLLDLSHIHYLHPDIHEGADFSDFTNKIKTEGETVWSMLWRHHYPLDAAKQAFYGLEHADVEGQGHSRWNVPGVLFVDSAYWDHGKTKDEGMQLPNAHLITPETETTSHYFWAAGRNRFIDNPAITAQTAATMKRVFETQDGPMVEAQQRHMGDSTDFLAHKPIILKADAAGVLARRIMKRRIAVEQGSSDVSQQVAAE